MIWLVLLILLIVVVGLGSILKAAFWLLVILAALAVALVYLGRRGLSRRL